MKILVISSLAFSLVNFRGELLKAMVAQGHRVLAAAPEPDDAATAPLAAIGVGYRQIPMRRAALSPGADLRTLLALVRLIARERPDVVLAYTQKPIIYGGIAARLAGRGRFFAMVSGLGHVFTASGSAARRLLRAAVSRLYRAAIRDARGVFVFNADDAPEMKRHRILSPRHRVVQVPGSGIDLARFVPVELDEQALVFLMAARLLRDKGLMEFVAAARMVRARHPAARFQILGPLDPNPSAIGLEEIGGWHREGVIEYLGETRDVRPFLAASSVFVLPSWYREGLPRTILEAMATGRAIITTDAPGCRETVEEGENGFLVPPRNAAALANAMLRFAREPGLAARMGRRSRRIAEARFDVRLVNRILLDEMQLAPARGASGRPVTLLEQQC